MAGREDGLNAHFTLIIFGFINVCIFLADGILPEKISSARKILEEVGN